MTGVQTCALPILLNHLSQRETWQRRLAPLAAVGRMALSNYLLQSLICSTIFYSYGLALFGKIRPSLGLLLTTIIFLIQIPLSVWWLRRFQFGPVEWLWRSLTYWQCQPMRVSPGRAQASDSGPAILCRRSGDQHGEVSGERRRGGGRPEADAATTESR